MAAIPLPAPEVAASELVYYVQVMYKSAVSTQYLHEYPNDAEALVSTLGQADHVTTPLRAVHIGRGQVSLRETSQR